MTPFDVVLDLAARVLLLSLPITVAMLAFRRLLLSRTANVWLYAMTVAYAAFAAIGVLPWALGMQAASVAFMIFALMCPLIWTAIVLVSGLARKTAYGASDCTSDQIALDQKHESRGVLVLENPITPEPVATPIFRHHASPALKKHAKPVNVMNIARSMRGRATSEKRRVRKLLPAPAPEGTDLPFLR